MENFWAGFEKRAVSWKSVSAAGKNLGGKLLAPFRGAARAGKGAVNLAEGLGGAAKNIERATGNVADLSGNVRGNVENIAAKIQDFTEKARGDLGKVTGDVASMSGDISKLPGIAGKLGLGALGIYGGSKLLGAPKAYQEYGYYKKNKELAAKQLEHLKALEQRG